jgi:hypothetical protein
MSDHSLHQFRYSFENKLVDIVCEYTPVASGAVTLTAAQKLKSKGIYSITSAGSGLYTFITNDKTLNRLVSFGFNCIPNSGHAAAPLCEIVSRGVDTTTGFYEVVVQFLSAQGTNADNGTSDVVLAHFVFADSCP